MIFIYVDLNVTFWRLDWTRPESIIRFYFLVSLFDEVDIAVAVYVLVR